MLISLTTLLATLSSIFRSRAALEFENLALRHQIGVLRRSSRKRPKLTLGACRGEVRSEVQGIGFIGKHSEFVGGMAL